MTHFYPLDKEKTQNLNEVFEIFTFPEEISIAGKEFVESIKILNTIRKSADLKELFGTSTRNIILKLDPKFKKEIEEHRERWTFLSYHGYGSMALRDISFYLEKFKQSIDDVSVQEKGKLFQTIFEAAEQKKKEYFKKYNVDTNFQLQFRLYSKIGAVKLYRRYIQLQNFYFLDQLISKISQNCNITEELLRNLFPEEVESLLKNELTLTEENSNRISSSAIIFSENGKEIITGNDADEIKLKLKNLSEETTLTSDILRGDPIGWQRDSEIIKGTCKIIEFKEDRTKIIFNHNDILVCEAADLDLYDLMQIAGAVLTEQGGVTSHSATVCRENNIKSIIGIKGLLENLNNNDLVEIDPNEGTVKKIALGIKELLYTAESELIQQDSLGSKAYHLLQLKKKGFNVPDFFCIPLDSLRTVLQKGTQDSLGSVNQKLWDAVNKALGNLHGELFAIRSSYSNEDSANFSGAGMNRSELHVAKEDIINTVISVASEIFFSPKNDLTGSIVIQQMILGDVSGILFSNNPVTKKENEILLEVVPGGNALLTDGKVKPIKFIIDKATKKIKEISKEQVWKDLIKEEVINEIVEKSIDIENFYAKAQDIEWTIANDSLFILQARPITNYNPDAKTPIYKIFPKANNDIISIYRSYRVPENLQAHMIQVSAVGNWIIDNWQGKKINSNNILTTLLLHDIGNLVKVPYDSFSNIFPEGYKFLPYWKAVQSWVRERYGNTDVQATSKIAKEIGVNERIIYLLENKQFVNNDLTCESADMELKICAYSDQRVSPYGIVPLKSRLQEAINRYKGNPNSSVNNPKRDKLIECAEKIETQIFSSLSKIPDEINNNSINHYIKELRNFHFEN